MSADAISTGVGARAVLSCDDELCRPLAYNPRMESELASVLFTPEQIRGRIKEMSAAIEAAYPDLDAGLTLLPVLSGSIIFLADLIRELPLKMKIAMIQLSAYPGATKQAQEPRVVMDVQGDVAGRHVLIIDDILDSGRTLRRVRGLVAEHEPASIRTAVLLQKPSKKPPDVDADFVGFNCDDLFVVGYGLDYDDHYRNLACIGVLKSEFM